MKADRVNSSSRRQFLTGLGSFGLIAGTRAFAVPAGTFLGGNRRLRVGILSDIHVSCEEGDFQKFGDELAFEQALVRFRDAKVDAVMVAGDLADNGMIVQMQRVADAWFRVFPANLAPDGRYVEKLFICGNHDVDGQFYDGYKDRFFGMKVFKDGQLVTDLAKNWERIFHEKYSPMFVKRVNGYPFVGWHWPSKGSPEITAAFAAIRGQLDTDRPIFYFQHPPAAGTTYGLPLNHSDADHGAAHKMFDKMPNAVVFAGHHHEPLTDDRFIWQGEFTSVCLPSYRYGCYGSAARAVGYGKPNSWWMNGVGFYKCRQGILMDVYDDKIVLACRDFETGEPVRSDVVIPLPLAAEKTPWAFAPRAAVSPAPAFPAGAKLKVWIDKADGRWHFEFPSATSEKAHVMGYAIIQHRPDGTTCENYALQPNFDKPAKYHPKVVSLSFAANDAPKGTTFTVVACDSFCKRSPELS